MNKTSRDKLTAVNQYYLHAEMYENWGYERLTDSLMKQFIDEMRHAESLMERILFLEGSLTMKTLEPVVGNNVKKMIESDLEL